MTRKKQDGSAAHPYDFDVSKPVPRSWILRLNREVRKAQDKRIIEMLAEIKVKEEGRACAECGKPLNATRMTKKFCTGGVCAKSHWRKANPEESKALNAECVRRFREKQKGRASA